MYLPFSTDHRLCKHLLVQRRCLLEPSQVPESRLGAFNSGVSLFQTRNRVCFKVYWVSESRCLKVAEVTQEMALESDSDSGLLINMNQRECARETRRDKQQRRRRGNETG